jgi:hypothetical protein
MARATKTTEDAKVEVEMNAIPDADLPTDDQTADVKTPRWTPLPADQTAWIAAHARPAISNCLCGCGGTTKGRFVPGHDATLKESLKVSAAAGDENAATALATFGW